MALTQLAIYNGALQLIGERRLNTLTDDVEVRYDLDNVWDLDPFDYCAEVVKPRFAVKTTSLTVTAGVATLPAGFITMVGLFSDAELDQPITRFTRDGNTIVVDEDVVHLRYIDGTYASDLSLWTPVFARVVMAYIATELSQQRNPDSYEQLQAVFQQRAQLAAQESAVEEPAMRPVQSASDNFKLSLYNNALMMVGLPRLKSLTDDVERRYVLDDAWEFNPAQYCAEMIKPRFAAKTVQLTTSTESTQHDLDKVYTLPADFVDLIGFFSDAELDQPITRFIREGNTIACDYPKVYLRYINSTSLDDFTTWSPAYIRAVYSTLAKTLAEGLVPERIESVIAGHTAYIEQAVVTDGDNDPAMRSKNSTTVITEEWLPVYNDALLLLGEEQLTTVDDDSRRRSILDVAVNAGLVGSILEDVGWHWAMTSMRITADPSIEPEWGFRYGHHLPTDLHRFDGVWYDEYFTTPIRRYTDEDGILLCDVEEIFIQYVSSDWLMKPEKWKPSFKRFVAAKLAYDTMNRFPSADKQSIMLAYEQRESDMKSIDAQQSPPLILTRGNWSRTRTMGGRNRGRP